MRPVPIVSVVMPAHNECEALRRVVTGVIDALDRWDHEVIVVDDGSTDGTWAEIASLAARLPGVRGLRLTRNFGHQAALVAGLRAARGAAVVTMDADGQHPAALLPLLMQLWEEGHRVVQTVRLPSPHEGWLKKTTSNAFYRVWSVLSGVELVRGAADFRLLDRSVVNAALSSTGSLPFLRGLIHWLGFPIRYVSFDAGRRLGGRPAYTWRRMAALSVEGLTSFSVVPLRLATALGIAVSVIAFAYLCFVAFAWMYSSSLVTGWASIAGLVALVGGIQLFTIGVLGEYVGRIFLRSTGRPQFVVGEMTPEPVARAGDVPSRLGSAVRSYDSPAAGASPLPLRRRLQAVPPPGA